MSYNDNSLQNKSIDLPNENDLDTPRGNLDLIDELRIEDTTP